MAIITNTAANLANGIGWKKGDALIINNGAGNNNATMAQLNLIRLGTHTTGAPGSLAAATVTDLSVNANDLNLLDAITTGKVVASAATTITGTAKQVVTAITATGITLAANVGVILSAGTVTATDLNSIDAKTTTTINASAVTAITGLAADIATALNSTGITEAANLTVTVSTGVAAATVLNAIDAKTTTKVNATAVTGITGLAADIATALNSAGITKAANIAVTVSAGVAAATDLNTIDAKTTAIINASAVTAITGLAANIEIALNSSGITKSASIGVTISAGIAAASDLNTIDSKTTAVIDATALTTITGRSAQVKTLYASTGINLSPSINVTLSGSVSVADLNSIDPHTTGVITAKVAEHKISTLLTLTGIGNAYTITVTDKTVNAADLNTIDAKTKVQVVATAVTSLTGLAADIATALSSTGISHAVNVGVTVAAGTVSALDLVTIDSNTTAVVNATAATTITGTAAEIAIALSSTGISHAANVNVTVDAGSVNAADLNTIYNALNASASYTGIFDASQVTELTGTQASIDAALATLNVNHFLSYTFAITLDPTAPVTVAELNNLVSYTSGVITATVSDHDLATLNTFVPAGGSAPNNLTISVTDLTASALDLILLSVKTTVKIDATAVNTFTGPANDIAYVVHSGAININTASNATVTGDATAADLNTIVSTLTGGTVDASQVTSITGTQTDIDTAITSLTSLSTTYAITVSTAITVVELNSLAVHTSGQITATVSDTNIATLLTYVPNASALNINNITFSVSSDSLTPVAATDLITLANETNVRIDATNVAIIDGTASDLASLINNINFSTALNISVDAGSVNAADLNTIYTALNASASYTGIFDASQVTELTGTQASIDTALATLNVNHFLSYTFGITLDPTAPVTVAELNNLVSYTSGVITATVSDHDLATLNTFVPAGGSAPNNLTISVTDLTASALDLILLSVKTTVKIDATAVNTFTGPANDIAYVVHSGAININTASNATVTGDATAADLNTIVSTLTGGTVDASQVTSITGTQTDIDTAITSLTSLSTTYAITVSTAITVAELNSLAAHTSGQITATVSDTNIATLLTYVPNASALNHNNVSFTVSSVTAVAANDLATLVSETNVIVDVTHVTTIDGTANDLANLINNINFSTALNITVNTGSVNAADLNTIDTTLNASVTYTGNFDATAVTTLTGTAVDIASAVTNAQIHYQTGLTAQIDAGTANAANLDTIATTLTGAVNATAVTEISGSLADINTVLGLSNVTFSSSYDMNVTDTGNLGTLGTLTTTGSLILGATSNNAITLDLGASNFSTVVLDGSGADTITASTSVPETIVLGIAQQTGTTINGLITGDSVNIDGAGLITNLAGANMGSAASVVTAGEWAFDSSTASLTYFNDVVGTAETIVLTGVTHVTLATGDVFTI